MARVPVARDSCAKALGELQSNCRSEDHQLQKASTPSTSTPLVTRKIGLKSRPLASSSTPVKYCALAPGGRGTRENSRVDPGAATAPHRGLRGSGSPLEYVKH